MGIDGLLTETPNDKRITPAGPDLLVDYLALHKFLQVRADDDPAAAVDKWEADTGCVWSRIFLEMRDSILHAALDAKPDRNTITHTTFLDQLDDVYRTMNFDLDTLCSVAADGINHSRGLEYAMKCCDVATEVFGLDRPGLSIPLQQMRSKILILVFDSEEAPWPLFTKSFLSDINTCWAKYPDALKEVSRHKPSCAYRTGLLCANRHSTFCGDCHWVGNCDLRCIDCRYPAGLQA